MKSESKFDALEQGQDSFPEYVSLKLLQLAASVLSWAEAARDAHQFSGNMWHNDGLEAYLCQTSKGRSYEEAKLLGGGMHLLLSGTHCSVSAMKKFLPTLSILL